MEKRTDDNADHPFVPRQSMYGGYEKHDCVGEDHGPVLVCDTCGRDYHQYKEEHEACPLGK
jgi:hypothetical protein